MEKLVQYFIDNIMIDLDGALNVEELRELLDDSPAAQRLIEKLQTEDDLEDFIITMTDALKEYLATGITPEVLTREFTDYAES